MSVKKKSISTLIETQLPEFITSEYELFSKFVTKYYEQLEVQGGTLDVLGNIQTYADINYYEKNLLKQSSVLVGNHTDSTTTIIVEDATSFPEENGYIKIDDEICFYKERTDNRFLEVSRGVSGNTKLGDLYDTSTFVSTEAATHSGGSVVQNISNLFLYALIKSFEAQYLGAFPEKYLKGEVDKRTLIKNIRKFYQAKGTDASVRFIFNTLVAGGEENTPTQFFPKDFTYKSSESDWATGFALKAKVLSGNVQDLIGKVVTQKQTSNVPFASATVDNIRYDGTVDGEPIYNILLAEETVNGEFKVTSKTELTKALDGTAVAGDYINVFSTNGWAKSGRFLIGNEVFTFEDKNITQFRILTRQNQSSYTIGTPVYDPIEVSGSGVTLLVFGLVYNLNVEDGQPYASTGDKVEISDPGFSTSDTKIVDSNNNIRWKLSSQTATVSSPSYQTVQQKLGQVSTDVSAVFEDEQYYYIASSGFPSHRILSNAIDAPTNVKDQRLLKLIRKQATRTTEIYKTPTNDVGVLVNGVRAFGFRDKEFVDFGKLESVRIDQRGIGYKIPPVVLVDGVEGKGRAVLAGEFVESVEIIGESLYPVTPTVEITSGRGARVKAIVTLGKITSLVVEDPGAYYTTPPIITIQDRIGRGRFAEYTANIENGKIVSFNQISEGDFYTQSNVEVVITPIGSGARGTAQLKRWVKNTYKKFENKVDDDNGYLFLNYNEELEYGYGYLANPLALRVALNDNIDSLGVEPANKVHSPILGFAYDGNPIYGPFGYDNPLDASSSIERMSSSYSLKSTRLQGPPTSEYPLGSFIDDYAYSHASGSLDQNNGRFCVTPEFPEGTYAYFVTIQANQTPVYPYIIGENFYSLPVDSNYNSNLSQADLPKNASRLRVANTPQNGGNVLMTINDVKSGSIENIEVVDTHDNFSVGSGVVLNSDGTQGFGAEALVETVKGKNVNFLESRETKATRLEIVNPAYLFAGDRLTQPASGSYGEVVGDVKNDNIVVLRDVQGTFDTTNTFSSQIKVITLSLDKASSFRLGSIIKLTDGAVSNKAYGEVLETTAASNVVTVKVLETTDFNNDGIADIPSGTAPYYFASEEDLPDHYIASNNLADTNGAKIISFISLSDGLEPFLVDQNVALVETDAAHGIGIGDVINLQINPNDTLKTTTYYVRKRIYQNLDLVAPRFTTRVDYTGIGRLLTYNVGWDYTPGTYTNIPLTGGSGEDATANIVVGDDGYVTEVQISDGGSGYKRQDQLSVADASLIRSSASNSTQRLILFVDHVGVSNEATKIKVADATRFVNNDFATLDSEVIKILSKDGNLLTVERGQQNTTAVDHYNNAPVSLKDGKYNFASNFAVNGSDSFRYDEETQKVFVTYPPSTDINTLQPITSANSFFDSSTPRRNVEIDSASLPVIKFEFKRGTTGEWQENPIIEVQEYYKYVFDTSDTSLLGTYLDFSPSKSLNLIPVERNQSDVLPGNAGASTDLKFGFGSRTAQNQYDEKQLTEFTNFYYYDRNGICNSEGSYLSLIKDPLTGRKVVNYVTPTRFVYSLTKVPQYDGSGSITYTTSSIFSIGEIATVKLKNVGDNYKKAPIVEGAYPTETYLASATVLYDDFTKKIISVRVDNPGSNYSNPKVVITDGDGLDASFSVTHRDGKVLDIVVTNPGKGYTKAPSIGIVEGDTKMFATGANIGVPKNVSIIRNGSSFHQDRTLYSKYTSSYVLALKNYPEKAFKFGEIVIQKVNNVEVARGVVANNGWREGSNLLKVTKVRGNFRQNFSVESLKFGNSGVITQIYVTEFLPQITSTYDNVGSYGSDRGRIGNSNQRITDSFFYQDFSYVIRSKTPINIWRDLIKSTTHPAGMKLFGEVAIEGSTDSGKMPEKTAKAGHYSVIQLWDPEKNKITSDIKQRVVTQTVQKLEDYKSKKGRGAANVQEYNFTDLLSDPVKLAADFDGRFNDAGQLVGTRTFTMQHAENNSIIQPYNEQALIVTLDGVIQEPGVAYTISGNQITFAAPPLGEAIVEGQKVPQQKFLARLFSFRDSNENSKVLKKIRNIFQRSGRWIDSANQINFNTDFIVLETVGWFESTYSSIISNNTLPWNILEPRFLDDVRLILQAIEHDIRFGGNAKTVDYAEIYKNSYDGYETYIENAFGYAIRLARMAILNWDWIAVNAEFNVSSDLITVQNTDNIALGAKVSAGSAFPLANEIEVTEIVSSTQVRVSSPPLYNSGVAPAGSASPGTTFLNGTQTQNTTLPTATGAVAPPNSYSVGPGTSLTAPPVFSGLNQVTFIYSGINNGTFYDASNLINKNREYITDYAVNWAKATYPLITWNTKETKCRRDIGYLLDAVIKHLRYGGNNDIVEFAELYFIGSQLKYIDDQLTETLATYSKVLTELCVNAIQQNLPGSPNAYTNVNPVIDVEVIADPNTPVCAHVVSALNSYYDIIDTIFNTGPTVVSRTKMNPTKVGKFTSLRPYANNNIILDLQLISSECADVISSVAALKENISDIFAGDSVTRTTPDYIDGETTEFELYYENGDPVILPGPADDLLVVLNGVLQRNKFNPTTPAFDSYHIDRVSRPNKIVFTSPPIWDQDVTARTLGEPTAVEKFFAFNIGSYKRFTTDKSLIQVEDSESKGPFLIVGVEDGRVYDVSDRDYVLVLVDGVIQEYESAYTIVGPQISFKYPLKKENVVDIRLLYGKDYEKIVTLYDYEPQYYLIEKNLRFTNGATFGGVSDQFADWYLTPKNVVTELVNSWMYQVRPNGTINAIGKPFAYYVDGNDFVFRLRCNNTEIIDGLDITVGMITGGLEFTIDTNVYTPTLTTVGMDPSGVISLIKESETFFKNGIPRANSVLKRKGFFTVALDDQIKVDGEDKFRKITDLPPRVYQREYYGDMSNSHYGTYEITSNDGTVRGEGLSVQAILEYEKDSNGNFVKDSNGDKIPTGKIESLVWNQKEVDFSDPDNPKIYKSTANQYYTPPILKFVSEDGEGGGARARVIVKGGSVISVDLIQRGFDYKTAPKVVVCREYQIRRSNDIDVNVIKLGINSVVQTDIVIASQVQPIALPPPEFAIISTVVLDSVVRVGDIIEAEIQLDESTAIPEEQPRLYVNTRRDQFLDVKQFAALDTDREIISVVSTRPVDITSVSTIAVSRVEATKLELQPQIAPGSTVETKFWSATKRNKFLEIQPAPEHDTFRKVISVVETTSPNVLSSSALTTSREKTVTINREIDNTFVENKNYYAAGAFLNANLPAGQSVVYIPDTSKFSSNGKLIVGTEIIYYPRKFSDRFVKCERAQEGTTEQSWIAGTYVRQLEDYVTVVPGGINVIESSGTVIMPGIDSAAAPAPSTTGYQVVTPIVTLQSSSRNITSEVQARVNVESISSVTTAHTRDYQIGTAGIELEIQHKQTTIVENHELTATIESSVKRDSTAVLIFTPPSGVIDFYVEEVVFPDPISTRLNGFISLVEKSVTQRSGNVIFVINESEGAVKYQGEYTPGNLGSNIGNWNNPGYDDGVCNVSNISIAEFARYFASVTIADFERRATSNFTLSGQKWNLANASIQNPVAISSSSGTIGGPIVVQDTTYFPNSGYLVSTLGSVIQYTSKTATTFEGCTLVRGTNTINANDKLVPFSID